MNSIDQVTSQGLDALREAIILALTGTKDEEALLKEHYDSLQDHTNISKKTLKRFIKDKTQIGPQTRNLLAAFALGKKDELISSSALNQNYYLDFLNHHTPETPEQPPSGLQTNWHFGNSIAKRYASFERVKPRLTLKCVRKSVEKKPRLSENFKQEIVLNDELLTRHSQVLVTGEAGIGKSTFAKEICFEWSQGENHQNGIPIYIDLKSSSFTKTENAIYLYIIHQYFEPKQDWMVLDFLEQHPSQYYFILDGFDELTKSEKGLVIEELETYSSNVNFMIFSRTYGFQDFGYPARTLYFISGLDLVAQKKFVKNYLTEISDSLDQSSLLTYIHSHNVLSHLARSPMHLFRLVSLAAKTKSYKILQAITSGIELKQLYYQYVSE